MPRFAVDFIFFSLCRFRYFDAAALRDYFALCARLRLFSRCFRCWRAIRNYRYCAMAMLRFIICYFRCRHYARTPLITLPLSMTHADEQPYAFKPNAAFWLSLICFSFFDAAFIIIFDIYRLPFFRYWLLSLFRLFAFSSPYSAWWLFFDVAWCAIIFPMISFLRFSSPFHFLMFLLMRHAIIDRHAWFFFRFRRFFIFFARRRLRRHFRRFDYALSFFFPFSFRRLFDAFAICHATACWFFFYRWLFHWWCRAWCCCAPRYYFFFDAFDYAPLLMFRFRRCWYYFSPYSFSLSPFDVYADAAFFRLFLLRSFFFLPFDFHCWRFDFLHFSFFFLSLRDTAFVFRCHADMRARAIRSFAAFCWYFHLRWCHFFAMLMLSSAYLCWLFFFDAFAYAIFRHYFYSFMLAFLADDFSLFSDCRFRFDALFFVAMPIFSFDILMLLWCRFRFADIFIDPAVLRYLWFSFFFFRRTICLPLSSFFIISLMSRFSPWFSFFSLIRFSIFDVDFAMLIARFRYFSRHFRLLDAFAAFFILFSFWFRDDPSIYLHAGAMLTPDARRHAQRFSRRYLWDYIRHYFMLLLPCSYHDAFSEDLPCSPERTLLYAHGMASACVN